ncbi:MAG TPA: glycosyl transferase family 90 [Candidatus Binataceae bacterium]|nr:glycosyl transferase family 90 [Candidatus Binataceae bacterium]
MTVSKEVVRNLTLPRLRAAVYFKDNPDVQFHLPRLVQCDSEETKDLLCAMGFGSDNWVDWRAQFGHRFIISMDGNGATCSRVFVTLRSNSVLLKYASPHQLHYFSGLIPWTHYIPIDSDEDVNQIVHIEQKCPGFFRHIAEQGQAFANRYLTRWQAMKYTGWLLRMYASSFEASSAQPWTLGAAVAELRRNAVSTIRILAHIANRGDVWFERGAWAGEPDKQRNIEGFALEPGCAFTTADIAYQAVLSDGSLSDWYKGGEFCGTRGKGLPIRGLRVRLSGNAASSYECSYTARFRDGAEVSGAADGDVCQAESRAPLVGFQINWRLRDG